MIVCKCDVELGRKVLWWFAVVKHSKKGLGWNPDLNVRLNGCLSFCVSPAVDAYVEENGWMDYLELQLGLYSIFVVLSLWIFNLFGLAV